MHLCPLLIDKPEGYCFPAPYGGLQHTQCLPALEYLPLVVGGSGSLGRCGGGGVVAAQFGDNSMDESGVDSLASGCRATLVGSDTAGGWADVNTRAGGIFRDGLEAGIAEVV